MNDLQPYEQKQLKTTYSYKPNFKKISAFALGWGIIKAGLASRGNYDVATCISIIPTTVAFGVGALIGDKIGSKKGYNSMYPALVGGTIATFLISPFEVALREKLSKNDMFAPEVKEKKATNLVDPFKQTTEEVVTSKPCTVPFSFGTKPLSKAEICP